MDNSYKLNGRFFNYEISFFFKNESNTIILNFYIDYVHKLRCQFIDDYYTHSDQFDFSRFFSPGDTDFPQGGHTNPITYADRVFGGIQYNPCLTLEVLTSLNWNDDFSQMSPILTINRPQYFMSNLIDLFLLLKQRFFPKELVVIILNHYLGIGRNVSYIEGYEDEFYKLEITTKTRLEATLFKPLFEKHYYNVKM